MKVYLVTEENIEELQKLFTIDVAEWVKNLDILGEVKKLEEVNEL